MALTKPSITQIAAFDASDEHVFVFSYAGDQFEKSKAVIKDNNTDEVVFEGVTTSWQARFVLPAGTLSNSASPYSIAVCVIDKAGAEGPYSDPLLFFCRSAPQFSFLNLADGQTIGASSYVAELNYAQNEGELLDSFQFVLYSANKARIKESGPLYDTASMQYTLLNLQDRETYYVEAVGETVNHMQLSTGLVRIVVSYIMPAAFSSVVPTNRKQNGDVLVSSNVISIDGRPTPAPPVYLDNKRIDLSAPGAKVDFSAGFSINEDFLLSLIVAGPVPYETLLSLSGENRVSVRYMENHFSGMPAPVAYMAVQVSSQEGGVYLVNSNYIPLPDYTAKQLHFCLKRVGAFYTAELSAIEKEG